MADKKIESQQFQTTFPGATSPLYFKTITTFTEDPNGKIVDGTAKTELLYTPNGSTFFVAAESTNGGKAGSWELKKYTPAEIFNAGIVQFAQPDGTILGPTAVRSLNTPNGVLNQNVQKSIKDIATKEGISFQNQQQIVDNLRNVQDPTVANLDITAANTELNVSALEGKGPRTQYKKGTEKNNGLYVYPTGLAKNGQDYIQFDIIKYAGQKLKTAISPEDLKIDERFKEKIGTICLPIQSQISDNNVVNWNQEEINAFQLAFAVASLNIGTGTQTVGELADKIENVLNNTETTKSLSTALRSFLAKQAVSSQGNLLSRLTGAVVNPNMELLFQGPLLRVFNFNFRLTPRDKDEADQVRYIIRAFKESSSVQRGVENLFLKAPNVFNIKYVKGGTTQDHPSLNRIKTCALRSFNVDYTPGGTYSTFNDPNYTMTSYGLQLQFQELQPIYSDDYSTGEESGTGSPVPYTHIGY